MIGQGLTKVPISPLQTIFVPDSSRLLCYVAYLFWTVSLEVCYRSHVLDAEAHPDRQVIDSDNHDSSHCILQRPVFGEVRCYLCAFHVCYWSANVCLAWLITQLPSIMINELLYIHYEMKGDALYLRFRFFGPLYKSCLSWSVIERWVFRLDDCG